VTICCCNGRNSSWPKCFFRELGRSICRVLPGRRPFTQLNYADRSLTAELFLILFDIFPAILFSIPVQHANVSYFSGEKNDIALRKRWKFLILWPRSMPLHKRQ